MKKGIHLIFLGAPGAGKGTQAALIKEALTAAHVSTGDLLRQAVKHQTPLGLEAKSYMDTGVLVPDSVILNMIKDTLDAPDFPENWIMDGFPRNSLQAEEFDALLTEIGQALTAVVNVDVPMDLLIDRLTLRRTCKGCGAIFNLKFNPPRIDQVCDVCQGELIQRSDDVLESVQTRLSVYVNETQPLISYYANRNILLTVNGNQSVETVKDIILSQISSK